MKTLPLSEAKSRLSSLVKQVRDLDEEITITVNGRRAAVVLSADEYDGIKEMEYLRAHPEFLREIRRNLKTVKSGRAKWRTLEEAFAE